MEGLLGGGVWCHAWFKMLLGHPGVKECSISHLCHCSDVYVPLNELLNRKTTNHTMWGRNCIVLSWECHIFNLYYHKTSEWTMEDEVASEVHHAGWLLRGWVQIHWSKALREPRWQQRKSLSANKYYEVTDCHIQCACVSDCVNWCHLIYQCSLSLVIPFPTLIAKLLLQNVQQSIYEQCYQPIWM